MSAQKDLESPIVNVFAICTLMRPVELKLALNSIDEQTTKPSMVVVIDGSKGSKILDVVQDFSAQSSIETVHLFSEQGLALQRNNGLDFIMSRFPTETVITHFIDDDVRIDQGYMEEIVSTFQSNPNAVCVGGRDMGRPRKRHALIGRLIGTDSKREGRVLSSGINVSISNLMEVSEVDWVSGMSQSFSLNRLGSTRFDSSINFHGEEVDMHVRCQEIGTIMWTPNAKLKHVPSGIGRPEWRVATRDMDSARLNLCIAHPNRFRISAFWFSTIAHMILKGAQGIVFNDSHARQTALGHGDFIAQRGFFSES